MKKLLVLLAALPLLAQTPGTPTAARINISPGTTRIVASNGYGQINVRLMQFSVAAGASAATFSFVAGTGTNCGTGQVVLWGALNGVNYTTAFEGALHTFYGQDFCITTDTAVSGGMTYTQQ